MIFSIDIELDQELDENSSIVYDVVQIFGIPLSDRSIKIVDKIEVDIKPGDIVYMTGEPGAGKSLLLNELIKHIAKYKGIFGRITLEKDIHIEDEVLIESIWDNTEDAIRLLSMVGLNDAYLFIKRYKELSEEQKYRYRIAKVIASNYDTRKVVVSDEFCSLLDRDTARVVAYMLAKICKTRGYTLLVATTHDDLLYDLNPSVIIRKYYGSRTDVIYNNNATHGCSVLKKMSIEEGSINDWYALEEFHYRSGKPFGIKHIFRAIIDNITVGIIIYSMPPLSCKGRNIALGRVVSTDEVNRDFITISRVVVSPRFRGIGIATMLVRDTMQRVGKRYVESIAIIGRYNPFLVKAGMIVYEPDGKYTEVMDKLEHYGFNRLLAANKDFCYEILQSMSDDDINRIREIVCNVRFAVKNAVGRNTEYSSNVLYDRHILAKAIEYSTTS